tara:strand:+ start:3988 stop:4230 length:243 start_codon:yes stop_codon:yes gene_type:complete
MKQKLLFPERILVKNPKVLIREELPPSDFTFLIEKQRGEFYLVVPNTPREIIFLQMLGKNIDLFLPIEGEGLYVKTSVLD